MAKRRREAKRQRPRFLGIKEARREAAQFLAPLVSFLIPAQHKISIRDRVFL